MSRNICNICGANYEYADGKWKCPACGAYKEEELSNEEVTLLYNAAQKLRLNAFDDAEEAYRDIIRKYPQNSEGYWGLVLAKYGIKYEQDYDGKMIPTCYATSYDSILGDKDYLRALDLANKDNRKYYETQAEKIEKIRKEWVEKASKEQPYDIFVSYKDTELENGVERTEDSHEAFELYTHLQSLGYRVFYSRESLKDKAGEKYEPYIFNALNTAHVMIVFGSKTEYIESTWIKNEWSRFYKRIKSGQKQSNALIVAYKGFNPSELSRPLSSVQCIDRNSLTFLHDLDAYVARVVKAAKTQVPHIERREIKKRVEKSKVAAARLDILEISDIRNNSGGGQSQRKNVEKREIGNYTVAKLTANAEKLLKIAYAYLQSGAFDEAGKSFGDFLTSSPDNGNALLGKLLAKARCKNIREFVQTGVHGFDDTDLLSKVLAYASKNDAEEILLAVCGEIENLYVAAEYDKAKVLYEQIQSFKNETVARLRNELFEDAITKFPFDMSKYFIDTAILYEENNAEYIDKLKKIFDKCLRVKIFDAASEYLKQLSEIAVADFFTKLGELKLKYKTESDDFVFEYAERNGLFGDIENTLIQADEPSALKFLHICGERCVKAIDENRYDFASGWLEIFGKYKFVSRDAILSQAIEKSVQSASENGGEFFERAVAYFAQGDFEKHADCYYSFAESARKRNLFALAIKYYDKAIEYGEDDIPDYIGKFYAEIGCGATENLSAFIGNLSNFNTLEELFSLYENEAQRMTFLETLLHACAENIKKSDSVPNKVFDVFEKLLQYIPKEYDEKLLLNVYTVARICLIKGYFSYSERYFAMSVDMNADDHTAYWGLLQSKLHCKSDEELIGQPDVISEYREFQNALLASANNSAAMAHYIDVQNKQKAWIEEKRKKDIAARKRKRILKITSLALAIVLVISAIITGSVLYHKSENRLKYTAVDGGYAVKAGKYYHKNVSGKFEIQGEYNGKPVVEISSGAFENFDKVTEFVIPDTVTKIGARAFAKCGKLQTVILPRNLIRIDDEAFCGTAIAEIVIPNSVEYIGRNAFADCDNLQIISLAGFLDIPSAWHEDWNGGNNAAIVYAGSITFNYNGATANNTVSEMYVGYEQNYTFPVPERDGYSFDGWYRGEEKLTDSQGKSVGVWKYPGKCSVDAHWTANENRIVFDGNGATGGSMSAQIICTDRSAKLTVNAFERKGYSFAGWSASINGSVMYSNGAEYKMGTNSFNLLYAVWTPNENEIVFNANGGSGSMTAQKIKTDATANLKANGFVRTGYDFAGWSTSANGNKAYDNGASYKMGVESSYTLYALWTLKTYAIEYNLGGGSVSGNPTQYNIESNAFTLVNPTRAGYAFAGWTGTGLSGAQNSVTVAKGNTGNRVYTATWIANINTITFHANGGDGNMSQQRIATDATVNLNENTFTRNGYEFAGWATSANGSKAYDNETKYKMGIEPNYDLYAVWHTDFEYSGTEEITIVKYNGTKSNVEIPSYVDDKKVISIADKAFYKHYGLISVTMPNDITSIGYGAFWGCSNLTSIEIPNSVTSIGNYAFNECYMLIIYCEEKRRPFEWGYSWDEDCTTIWDCKNNKKDENGYEYGIVDKFHYGFKDGLAKIRQWTTNIMGTIVIPSEITYNGVSYSVTSIGDYAFSGCSSLTSIEIPNSVTSIGRSAFYNCNSIMSITVDNNNQNYSSQDGILYNKAKTEIVYVPLTITGNLTIPSSVTSIGDYAFRGCSKLTSIEIPSGVTSIGSSAFENCGKLTSIEIPSSVMSIGANAFRGCSSLTSIEIPSGVTSIGATIFLDCSNLESITVDYNNPNYSSQDGILYNKAKTKIIHIPKAIKGNIVIPSGITSISEFMFSNHYRITSIQIPNSVTSIARQAFRDCYGLKSITIPNSVTSIGENAFYGCDGLKIYCEANKQPNTWSDYWYDSYYAKVYWGYEWEYVDGVPTLKS